MKHDEFVSQIIDLRDKMLNIFAKSFNRDQTIEIAIKNAFESFINESEKTAMSLVFYLDDQFKRDFKGMGEQDVTERIDKVI